MLGRRAARRIAAWVGRRRRRSREPHGLVLMYHRVARIDVDPWNLGVDPGHFESQVRALSRHADIVPLSQLLGRLRPGRRSRPVVAITFDDGYVDNLVAARPILERYEAPATVFLATGFTGRREDFWWDRLAHALLVPPAVPPSLVLGQGPDGFHFDDPRASDAGASGARARRQLHDRLWDWLSRRGEAERGQALEAIEAWAGVRPPQDASAWPMTPDEVRRLAAGGLVEVGAHTSGHPRLPLLSRADKTAEIQRGRDECQRLVGVPPPSFAFPHGEYDDECVAIVREAGFCVACTSRPDLAWASGDPHTLPRIAVPDCSGEALWRRLSRWWLA